jgi:hypothetical protein
VARGAFYQGVWKVDREGNASLEPGADRIAPANALAFDKQGNLYISETLSLEDPIPYDCPATGGGILPEFGAGGVWVVPKGGGAELWIRDEVLLTGLCLFPIGANGIA